jgi:uncharacterized protein (TIGR02453 family)
MSRGNPALPFYVQADPDLYLNPMTRRDAPKKKKYQLPKQKTLHNIMTIKTDTIKFLKDLKKNNDRDWFAKNKDRYLSANEDFIEFVQSVINQVAKFDTSVAGLDAKSTVFRIYRDTRFSKDKSPYKTGFGAVLMGKGNNCGIAGYYLHLEPGKTFLAGGVHVTEPENLKAIREEISQKSKEFLKIIGDKQFRDNLTIGGEKLVNVPKGFDKEDPMADYLKFKELMLRHSVPDQKVLDKGFDAYCAKLFKTMVPFNTFVNKPVMALK